MLLLVSVRNAPEALAAAAGGADVIDAKDPDAGALGPVGVPMFREIHTAVGHLRPVSAALGDAEDEASVERDARAFADAGAAFVKVGFAGITSARRVGSLLAAAARGSRDVIAVGYADATGGLSTDALIDIAAGAGARGVLLDTADKTVPGLRSLMDPAMLSAWVSRARAAGLLVALAGRLTADDLGFAADAGAHIAGVRGAACSGGRRGIVSAACVRQLQTRLRALTEDRRPQAADLV